MTRPSTAPAEAAPAGAAPGATPIRPLPPRTPYEDAVVGILGEVLGCTDVLVHDRLLALGDLAAVPRVVAQLRRTLGVDVPVADYVEAGTVAGLAALVAGRSVAARRAGRPPALGRRTDDAVPVLSHDQQRLWMENQLLPGSIYNVHGRRRIRGVLDVDVLQASIHAIVARHETLRTRFPATDTTPVQVVDLPAGIGDLRREDVSGTADPAAAEAAALALLDEELTTPFDLESGPLFRCMLVRVGPTEHLLSVTMHHIVSDAWSVGLFVRELTALHRAAGDPVRAGLPRLDVQYRDYAVWQRGWLRGDALEARLDHWRAHLDGAPAALALPTVQRRTNALRAEAGQVADQLTRTDTAALHTLCREHGVTSFMVLYAVFASLLARWSGQHDVVVGVPVAGRHSTATEGLVGFFVNLLPLRVDLSDDPAFDVLLDRVREAAVSAYAHTEAPMDEVVRDLEVVRDPRRTPLFEVVLNVVASPEAERVAGLEIEPVDTPSLFSRYDLNLTAQEDGGVLRFRLDFPADRLDLPHGRELLRQLRTLLAAAVATPTTHLLTVPLAAPVAPPAPAPAPAVHRSVAWHAADPTRVAVHDTAGDWSYAWLAAATTAVADALADRGAGTVGVVRRPGAAFVAALTGASRAGRPVTVVETDDPALTGPLGLTTVVDPAPAGPTAVGTLDLTTVLPDRDAPLPATERVEGPGPGPAADRLGYGPADRVAVLTGRPGHLAAALGSVFHGGGTFVVPDPSAGADAAPLAAWIDAAALTVVHLDAPVLRGLATATAGSAALPSVRLVVLDNPGDLLPHDVAAARTLAPGCRVVAVHRPGADGRPVASHEAPADLTVADAPLRVPLGTPTPGVVVELRRATGAPAAVGEPGALVVDGEPTGDHARRGVDGTLHHACASAAASVADPVQTLAALRDVPGVTDAVVLTVTRPGGGTELVGHVAGPDATTGPAAVQGHVKVRLPDYLVPRQVHVHASLPRTPWGEYDLRTLAGLSGADGDGAADGPGHVGPRSPVERQLVEIIAGLLELEQVGVYDSFFELGGFSMLATQVITRIRDAFGVHLAVRDVFEAPTVDELAPLVVAAQAAEVGSDDLEALLGEVERA